MYDQIRQDTLFIILYSMVTATAVLASCYLLFRQGNAFAKDVTPPARLRRWAAAFFAAFALNHLWYMPIIFLSSNEDIRLCDLIGGLLDSMTVFPLIIVVLFAMLQDRRRPLWPIAVMFAPIAVGNAFNFITRSYAFLPIAYIYFLLMCMGLIIYMVREVRRYGRWLRDNYADLEHKEVWQSFLIQTVILLTLGFYVFGLGWPAYEYVVQACDIFLVCYLLWRVETLSDLSISEPLPSPVEEETITTQATYEYIAPLLQQYCIDTHLYLQHDLTLLQLAKTIGTNRFYLSQYFSNQGTTYNAYINDLRVNYFIILYREAVDARRSFTAQQLAKESGFRNYNTFNNAFKRKMGLSVTAWMKQ